MAIFFASALGFAFAFAVGYARFSRWERFAILVAIAGGQGIFAANYMRGGLWFGGDMMARTGWALLLFLVFDFAVYKIAQRIRDR